MADRAAQALEASEWIRKTSRGCDVAVYAGDLNTQCGDLPWKILTVLGDLKDDSSQFQVTSYGAKTNSYTTEGSKAVQIDHVLIKGRRRRGLLWSAQTNSMWNPMPAKIPGKTLSFSDHEAVAAEINITPTLPHEIGADDKTSGADDDDKKKVLNETLELLVRESRSAWWTQVGIVGLAFVILAIFLTGPSFSNISSFILGAIFTGFVLMAAVLFQERLNGLEQLVTGIQYKIDRLPHAQLQT